jgi:hypothetical protein
MHDNRVQVDRFWFGDLLNATARHWHSSKHNYWKKRHEISEDNLNRLFDVVMIQLQNVQSLFVWNPDETRVGISKKYVALAVIFAKQILPWTVTIAEEHDNN